MSEKLFGGNGKVALVDADTIAYASASGHEYAGDLLGRSMYSDEEWETIVQNPNYDKDENCIWDINLDDAVQSAISRIEDIKAKTDCGEAELYFTTGLNFRHKVCPMYKANRKHTRYPVGLREIKTKLLEHYPGCVCEGLEADDIVVYLKRTEPEKYVLCAVDKDVYRSVAGKHWNYYYSAKYNIEPKWVETTKEEAEIFPYIQTLTGDSTDNIAGCPGIGPKKAIKALIGKNTPLERWTAVVGEFTKKKLTVKDAIRDMRLVNMHQTIKNKEGKFSWEPWTQPLQ